MKRHDLYLINYKYSELILEKNINLFSGNDWVYISSEQKLSELFIEKHAEDRKSVV